MLKKKPAARAAVVWTVAVVLAVSMAACGGGGGDAEPAPPTALPATLQLQTPPDHSALGAALSFGSNAVDPARKLSYRWQFGDGSASTEAAPTHSYARAGMFTVTLTLTNEAGASTTSQRTVSISDLALVAGKSCGSPGWCWQRPLPQGNAILDYHFVDAQRGFAVGEAGTVLATSDGGLTWTRRASGTDLNLTKVRFADAQNGWIAGEAGHLLRTTDGGATWTAASTGWPTAPDMLGAYDATTPWMIASGLYASSTDGGANWTRVANPGYSSHFSSGAKGDLWGVQWDYPSYALRHSTDGGAQWTTVALPPLESYLSRWIDSVQFVSATQGWVRAQESGYDSVSQQYVSRTRLLRTADAGASWQPFTDPWAGNGGYNSATFVFADAGTGYAWHEYQSAFKRSSDAGTSWSDVTLPIGANITSVKVFSALVLMVRDWNGRVLLSTDGGASWATRGANGPQAPLLNGVWFFDSREGIAVSAYGTSTRTTDGGQTWTEDTANQTYDVRRLQFLADGSVGWMISSGGRVYRSTDKGRSWASAPGSIAFYDATDLHFIDAQQGWMVSPSTWNNKASVARTLDGGLSWQPLPAASSYSGLRAIRFADASNGVAVGSPGIAVVTADGGATWQSRPTGTNRMLNRIAFVDAQTVVAVGDGGTIVRSADRGRNWTRVQSPVTASLHDLRFVSARTGWAVGENGTVVRTVDGGLSWAVQPTGTFLSLQGAFFLDEQTGWLVGANGTILVTATGGR